MRIEVNKTRVEGWCNIPGWRGEQSVVAFTLLNGEWHTACSMCLPSDVHSAKIVNDCVTAAFAALQSVIDSQNQLDNDN